MLYPNKTYILDTVKKTEFGNRKDVVRKHIVIVVAKDSDTACQHLKDKLGFDGVPNDLIWLMDCDHPTIYNLTGEKELPVQAKIIYNTVSYLQN